MIKLLALILCLIAAPAQAAITFFGHAQSPTDNGSQDATATRSVTPPGSMAANDYVLIIASLAGTTAAPNTLSISQAGGQTWTSETAQASADIAGVTIYTRIFHTRFNGTWGADPSVARSVSVGNGFSLWMLVFRGVDTTSALDVALAPAQFSAAQDITITGITTNTNNAMAVAVWIGNDDNDWTLQTGTWSVPTPDSLRNTAGVDHSQGVAYMVQAAAGGTGNVTNRENQGNNDPGVSYIFALKEQAAAATVVPAAPIFFP